MTKIITISELEDLTEEARQNGEELEQWQESSVTFRLPQRVGHGGGQVFQLRNGCQIATKDGTLQYPIYLDSYISESQAICMGFYPSGSFKITNPGLKAEADRVEGRGETCLSFMRDIRNIEYFPAEQHTQHISISIHLDTLRSFSSGWNVLPEPLQQLLHGKEIENFHQSLGLIKPTMQRVLDDILRCSYQGIIRQIYLEGKVLELLALQLMQWVTEGRSHPSTAKLRRQDVERLYHAKEIMAQTLDNPPSLLELAQQVGLNDHKLKWGFRQLFGMTVFEHLHSCQMQAAQRLLTETAISITEVANTVGYASLPSFSGAFRKRFGMSPREYRDRYQ